MARAVTLIKDQYPEGKVKLIFLMAMNAKSQPPTQKDLQKFESDMNFNEHAMALSDGKGSGITALMADEAEVKVTLILSRGYKISNKTLGDADMAAAVEAALNAGG